MSLFRRPRPLDASQVVPGLLVGSAPDGSQCAELSRRGVTVVVDLRAEAGNERQWPAGVLVRRMPVPDHHAPALDQIQAMSGWVVDAMRRGEVVLIHCHAGIGRAATLGCATLMELGYGLADAYNMVREARPVIAPSEAQLAVLRRIDRLRRPATSMPTLDRDLLGSPGA